MTINFEKIDKALSQLEIATSKEPANDLERDGAIQRFEYTIELLWKVSKKVLEDNGIAAIAPKEVIRELANIGWINNPEEMIDFIKMRNETSHSYKEDVAIKVFEASKKFTIACKLLVDILKEKSK
jgi:nucleotidyltransferase substrate binding protein (TIGR01987 family)